jgi:hypothetical protein
MEAFTLEKLKSGKSAIIYTVKRKVFHLYKSLFTDHFGRECL